MPDRSADIDRIALPDRYRVLRVIGSGGTATVYLAEDAEAAGRTVAVKVLNPSLVGAVAVDRFLREIRLVRELRHPGIVPVLDAGEANGVPFFVMPFIEGESLRRRLLRERQLPLDDAVQIVRTLAVALEAAHAAGVVHRDVKPENVLVRDGDVLLADFGIARALSQSVGDRLTDSGLAIGTPGYMSPEQATGERDIDVRTDIYSLGCLAFEMLSGETPYSGASAQAVVAKQLTLPVPSLLVVRDTLPPTVDDVVRRALARVPADRYRSAAAFAAALEAASRARVSSTRRLVRRLRRHAVPVVSAGVALIAVVAVALNATQQSREARRALVAEDTLRYAVLPFQGVGVDTAAVSGAERRVRDALLGWTGVTVVDAEQVGEAASAAFDASPTRSRAHEVAVAVRAGRYVRGEVRTTSAGTEWRLRLLDAFHGDSLLAEASAAVPPDGRAVVGAVTALLDSLLLRDALRPAGGGDASRSLSARQAFGRGQRAIDAWELKRADSAFLAATQYDPQYAAAHVWLSLSRLWSGVEPARWRIAAEQGVSTGAALPPRERAMALAVLAEARDDRGEACPRWRALTQQDSSDAVAWYGAARCLAADNRVVTDGRSPSGFRFRTSYHEALRGYERAFRLHPPMLASLGDNAFDALGELFKSGTSQLRGGRAEPPSTRRFSSSMEWSHDSLVFVPYPWGERGSWHDIRHLDAVNEATRRQRSVVRGIASAWVAAFPESPDAWQALALSLASLGESSALDTLARARAKAITPEARRRVAATDVALQLSFGLRDGDSTRLRRARVLADSLLAEPAVVDPAAAIARASIAALTGRVRMAQTLARSPAVSRGMAIPTALQSSAAEYLVLSALGVPADTLRALEARLVDAIERGIAPPERLARRAEYLARGASMAFPSYTSAHLAELAREGDPLIALQLHRLRGDSTAVRSGLEAVRRDRRAMLPEHVVLDALAPEAALLWSIGDAQSAVDWLLPTLTVLPQSQPNLLSSPIIAGSLVRALLTLSRATAALGDARAARRWSTAVVILWSNADPMLQPLVEEARRMAR